MPKIASQPTSANPVVVASPAVAAQAAQSAANASKPTLSTASLTETLKKEFAAKAPEGEPAAEPAAPNPPAQPGQEPSPGGTEGTEGTPGTETNQPADPPPQAMEGRPDKGQPNDDDNSDWPANAIDVVTALRAERRELRAELKAEHEAREKAEAAAKAAAPEPAKAGTPNPANLSQEEVKQSGIANFCRDLLRRAARDPEGAVAELAKLNVPVTNDTVVEFLENARDEAVLAMHDARVTRMVQESTAKVTDAAKREKSMGQALSFAPELKDPNNARTKQWQALINSTPLLQTSPDGPLLALVHVLGIEAFNKLGKKAEVGGQRSDATKPPAPPPRPARPGQKVTAPSAEPQSARALFKKYQESGKPEDREAWVKATLAEA